MRPPSPVQAAGGDDPDNGEATGSIGDDGEVPLLLSHLREQSEIKTKCLYLTRYLRELEHSMEDFREFSLLFPVLLAEIFGLLAGARSGTSATVTTGSRSSSDTTGWIFAASESRDAEDGRALTQLLAPDGPVCQLALRHQDDPNLTYHFPFAHLPWPVRQKIEAGDVPALYHGKLAFVPGSEHRTVSLKMFEYFAFCFVYCPVFHQQAPSDRQQRGGRSSWFADVLRSDSDRRRKTPLPYPELARLYCAQFMPSPRYSPLFVHLICDFWLGQNAPPPPGAVESLKRAPSPGWGRDYIVPTPTMLLALKNVCRFLIAADTSGQTTPPASTASTTAKATATTEAQRPRGDELDFLRPHLFNFLRLALLSWDVRIEAATPFSMIVDTWLNYISPWTYVSDRRSPEAWALYIEANFLFYSPLLGLFLRQATRLNFVSAADCRQLDRVLAVFEAPFLRSSLLPSCEAALIKTQPDCFPHIFGPAPDWDHHHHHHHFDTSILETSVPLEQIDRWQAIGSATAVDFEPLFFSPPVARERVAVVVDAHAVIRGLAETLAAESYKLQMKEQRERELHARLSFWDRLWTDSRVENTGDTQRRLQAALARLRKVFPHLLPAASERSRSDPVLHGPNAQLAPRARKPRHEEQKSVRFEGPAELLPPGSDELAVLVTLARHGSAFLHRRFGLTVNLRRFASYVFLVQIAVCLFFVWLLLRLLGLVLFSR